MNYKNQSNAKKEDTFREFLTTCTTTSSAWHMKLYQKWMKKWPIIYCHYVTQGSPFNELPDIWSSLSLKWAGGAGIELCKDWTAGIKKIIN